MSKYGKHLLAIATILVIVVYGIIIWNSTAELKFDQKKLLNYTFTPADYPEFESGITSRLLVGLYNRVDDWEPVTSNAHIRAVAMVLYVLAGYLLFTAAPAGDARTSLLFMLLLWTSRYPFLWLSSELFAGAFLMLIFWSILRKHPFAVTALFVALFAFSKPDLIFTGSAVGLFLAYTSDTSWRPRLINAALLLAILTAFLLPGLVQDGPAYLQSQGRALYSFRQHYAALVQNHQMTTVRPDPWAEWEPYFLPVWGPSESIVELVTARPDLYLDFLFLSAARSLRNFVSANLIFLIPVWAYAMAKISHRKIQITSLLLLIGFLPITLLSFTHVRYIARFYPLLLVPIYWYLNEYRDRGDRTRRFMFLYLLALLGLQLYQLLAVLPSGHWFPD